MEQPFSYDLYCGPLGLSYFRSALLPILRSFRNYVMPSSPFVIPYHVVSNNCSLHKFNIWLCPPPSIRHSLMFPLSSHQSVYFLISQIFPLFTQKGVQCAIKLKLLLSHVLILSVVPHVGHSPIASSPSVTLFPSLIKESVTQRQE